MRLAAFAGRWRVRRAIRGSERARFTGEAVFAPEGAGWRCREAGELVTPAGRFAAARETLFEDTATGLAAAFADGRPFYTLDWGAPRGVHRCPPDLYEIAWDLSAWPRWRTCWRVRGPAKDYVIATRYARP